MTNGAWLTMDVSAFRQRSFSQRLAGASGALLLQAGLLLLFLSSMPQISRPIETGPELTFVMRRPTLPLPPPPPPVPGVAAPARPAPVPLVQTPPAFVAPPQGLPDLHGLGEALNNCAPERYARLTEEDRARCPRPGGSAPSDDLAAPHALAKDEAHWQTELARKQSPLWLPCTAVYGHAIGINFYCIGMMAAQGTLFDQDAWPIYGPAH